MASLFSNLNQSLLALSVRERLLLLIVIVSVLYAVWDTVFFTPQQQRYQQLREQQTQWEQKQQETLRTLTEKATDISRLSQIKQQKQAAILQAKAELDKTHAQLEHALNQLVPPTQITALLQNLLSQTHGLTLLEINNEPVQAIPTANPSDTKTDTETVLYQHATRLKLKGNYQQLYAYLKAIEQSKWRLYWDSLSYHVTHYPSADITLRVHTISTDKYWIGL